MKGACEDHGIPKPPDRHIAQRGLSLRIENLLLSYSWPFLAQITPIGMINTKFSVSSSSMVALSPV